MKNKHLKEIKDITGKTYNFILIVLLILIFDRLTKYLVLKYLKTQIVIIPKTLFLNLTFNTGAGLGILKGKTLFLIITSILIISFIFYNLKKILKERYYWAIALILGGALANLFDRISLGFVIDFIELRFFSIFNIADIMITFGTISLIIYLFTEKNDKKIIFKR